MNLFENSDAPQNGEIFETLLESKEVLIERIISSGKQEKKLYKQDHDEWVMIAQGEALLQLEKERIRLKKGDWLLIKQGIRHQVLETISGTLWLCVHIKHHDK